MAWIAHNRPPSARFVVVSGVAWFIDADWEWFPVVARPDQRLATVQGYEWLGGTNGPRRSHRTTPRLCKETGNCLAAWATANAATDAWLYLPIAPRATPVAGDDCCAGLRASLEASWSYDVVYQGPGGTVFRPRRRLRDNPGRRGNAQISGEQYAQGLPRAM